MSSNVFPVVNTENRSRRNQNESDSYINRSSLYPQAVELASTSMPPQFQASSDAIWSDMFASDDTFDWSFLKENMDAPPDSPFFKRLTDLIERTGAESSEIGFDGPASTSAAVPDVQHGAEVLRQVVESEEKLPVYPPAPKSGRVQSQLAQASRRGKKNFSWSTSDQQLPQGSSLVSFSINANAEPLQPQAKRMRMEIAPVQCIGDKGEYTTSPSNLFASQFGGEFDIENRFFLKCMSQNLFPNKDQGIKFTTDVLRETGKDPRLQEKYYATFSMALLKFYGWGHKEAIDVINRAREFYPDVNTAIAFEEALEGVIQLLLEKDMYCHTQHPLSGLINHFAHKATIELAARIATYRPLIKHFQALGKIPRPVLVAAAVFLWDAFRVFKPGCIAADRSVSERLLEKHSSLMEVAEMLENDPVQRKALYETSKAVVDKISPATERSASTAALYYPREN